MIIKGTTPTHTFTLPVDTGICKKIRIIYSQGKAVFKREKEKLVCDGNKVSCTLTQQETLALDHGNYCEVQIRILTNSGDALAGNIANVDVGRTLDNEVLE